MKDLRQHLLNQLVRAMRTYHLIDDGDRILVALSGGKDSLCLLDLLAQRQRIFMPRFSIEAIHIRMENIDYSNSSREVV